MRSFVEAAAVLTVRTKVILAGAVALAFLSWVGVVSYRSVLHADEDQYWVTHTHSVLRKLDNVLTDLMSAEASEKAYALSGDQSELAGYESSAQHLQADLEDVAELTSDNPRQQQALENLRPLIARKLADIEEGLAIRGRQETKAATAAPESLEKLSWLEITSNLTRMKQEESRLLIQRSQATTIAFSHMKAVIVFGDVLAFLLLAVAAFQIQQEISRRDRVERELHRSEERFRLMVSGVKEYAIFMLGPKGHVTSWNSGAQRIKGYGPEEIIGRHFSCFYPAEDIKGGKPENQLKLAAEQGQAEEEGWRVRKDGSKFWAGVLITRIRDSSGWIRGFSEVTRDLTERRRAEEEIKRQNAQLEATNKELEAFSYSVAHDLRAPLRVVDGFSLALLQDFPNHIPAEGKNHLERIRTAIQRMAQLIEDLSKLAGVSHQRIERNYVDLSRMAKEVAAQLQTTEIGRQVKFSIEPGLVVNGDRSLLRILVENLLGNAWKFTSRKPRAEIQLGARNSSQSDKVFFVRDNGSGFDMESSSRLFGVFQRLHTDSEFPGTGVGLATVQRIVHRHGGKIWAEAAVGEGATFYFVL